MGVRKIKGTKIFDGYSFIDKGVLVTEDNGRIIEIIRDENSVNDIEFYEGIICPGLINAHCHIELSHLQGKIPKHIGLISFLKSVSTLKKPSITTMVDSIKSTENYLYNQGVVGVGDICSSELSISTKKQSKIRWHNFLEIICISQDSFSEKMGNAVALGKSFEDLTNTTYLRCSYSFSPHAPYTVLSKVHDWINDHSKNNTLSIHFLESKAENAVLTRNSKAFDKLYNWAGVSTSPLFKKYEISPESVLPHYNQHQKMIFVHNSFISQKDIQWMKQYEAENSVSCYFCICINANEYIEQTVPPIDIILQNNGKMLIGTDSLASNNQLSMANEIKKINKEFPAIGSSTLLASCTSTAAEAFGWQNELGSFEKGKYPGVTSIALDFSRSQKIL